MDKRTANGFALIGTVLLQASAVPAIIQALQERGKLNHTQLRSEAKRIDASLSDANIRDGITTLEGTQEIIFIVGGKGAKIYELKEDPADE